MADIPTRDDRTDAELFAAINRGDASAFDTLYAHHRDFVARLAHRFTADHADAMDVLQEVFLHLVRKVPNLRLEGRATTYLYVITRSVAISVIRRRRTERTGHIPFEDADLATPPANDASPPSDLHAMLSNLSPAHREVLVMRYVDDLTNEEIASVLSIPLGTVKSRLHQALANLREDPRAKKYFASE